jgi:anti-sigma regulatory factor (Ser/Thr protein kinase)
MDRTQSLGARLDGRIRVDARDPAWVELSMPCDMSLLEQVQAYFEKLDSELPARSREALSAALHELLANAIEWGGGLDPTQRVSVRRVLGKKMVMYHISDPGRGFCEQDIPHSAFGQPEAGGVDHLQIREGRGLRPGGYGLLLARKLVDELIFNEAHNQVLIVMYL